MKHIPAMSAARRNYYERMSDAKLDKFGEMLCGLTENLTTRHDIRAVIEELKALRNEIRTGQPSKE
jgi:hypothetical protein